MGKPRKDMLGEILYYVEETLGPTGYRSSLAADFDEKRKRSGTILETIQDAVETLAFLPPA